MLPGQGLLVRLYAGTMSREIQSMADGAATKSGRCGYPLGSDG
jgi:hypothetical protein